MQTHPMILSSTQLLKIIFMILQHSNIMYASEESIFQWCTFLRI